MRTILRAALIAPTVLITTLALALAPGALAQAAPAAAPAPPAAPTFHGNANSGPQLTRTELIALQSIFQEFNKLSDEQKEMEGKNGDVRSALKQIEADIRAAHPGYHLNTSSGALDPDSPSNRPPTHPASVPAPKPAQK